MKTPIPWLCGLAVVVVLNIVASLFNSRFYLPLMLAAYVIGIALFSKLGVWPALALWWVIGLVIGWSYEFRRARHSKDAEAKPPSLVTVVHGLFAWPITVPLKLLAALGWVVVDGVCSLCYSLYKKLLPNHVLAPEIEKGRASWSHLTKRAGGDRGIPRLLDIVRPWPAAPHHERSAHE